MSTFFCSDTHFSHKNVIRYSNRPFSSVAEMNEIMIENWNNVVKPTDNVWHLGDFAFAKVEEIRSILRRLNGFKMFIFGNHDSEIARHRDSLLGRDLFYSIGHYADFRYNSEFIVLFHYAMRVWNKSHYRSILLHGHSHGSLPPFGRSVDVGVDAPFVIARTTQKDYRPVSIEEVLEYMKNRPPEFVDHHNV